jgi:hypothetical protein
LLGQINAGTIIFFLSICQTAFWLGLTNRIFKLQQKPIIPYLLKVINKLKKVVVL